VAANEGTRTGTNSGSNGSAYSRITGQLANDGTQNGTTACTNGSSLYSVVTTHHNACAQRKNHHLKLFHNCF
jgi:hypothetical protein